MSELANDWPLCPFCGEDCAAPNYGLIRGAGRYRYFVSFCCGQLDDYDDEAESDAAWKRRDQEPSKPRYTVRAQFGNALLLNFVGPRDAAPDLSAPQEVTVALAPRRGRR